MTERHCSVGRVSELSWIEPNSAPLCSGMKFDMRAKPVAYERSTRRLGYNLYKLPPGKRSFTFHHHLAQDEALTVARVF